MKIFFSMFILFFCLQHSIFGQAKVGTTGAQFLDLSPSVQAIGMGEAAAATTVHSAVYNNPAAIGFVGLEDKIIGSLFPVNAKFPGDVRVQNYELLVPISSSEHFRSRNSFAIGFYHFRLHSGVMIERDYRRVETGRTFTYNARSYNLLFGYAHESSIQFAVGAAVKYIEENAHEYSADGFSSDIGILVKFPIIFSNYGHESIYSFYMSPSFGLAFRNYGPDMEFITNKYPLPKSRALGLAYEFGLRNFVDARRELDAFRILLALEIDYQYGGSELHKIGTEISLYELFNIRLGQINFNDNSNKQNTLGFSLSTDRIGKFLFLTNGGETSSRFLEFITEKLSLEYNYARKSNNYFDDITYHELVVSYHL